MLKGSESSLEEGEDDAVEVDVEGYNYGSILREVRSNPQLLYMIMRFRKMAMMMLATAMTEGTRGAAVTVAAVGILNTVLVITRPCCIEVISLY